MSLSDTASFSGAAAPGSPISSDSVVSPCSGGLYSIRAHFNPSCSVLLTGATGYIGSLMLEKLLRSTTVGRVYVLVRPRRGYGPADRLARLMSGPLFHLIGEEHAARVTAVAGDILAPGLGLSLEDEQLLLKNVDTVIHSAADIRLDAPIHETLAANYSGTLSVVRLAMRMQRLRSLTYVSTCYTNINRPRGSLVEERLYPLTVAGKEVDITGLAEELLALPAAEASARAAHYIELWGFRNTYALGKHLAEKALADLQRELRLPLAIVRPSLVSAIAAEPYPGYSGNFAGPVGGAAAYLTGLYDDQPEAVACDGSSIWDIVPGDVAVHGIIAAAAAVAAPAARASISPPSPLLDTAHARGGKALVSCMCNSDSDSAGEPESVTSQEHDGEGAALPASAPPLMIVQIATSCTYPLTTSQIFNDGVLWCAAHRRPFTLAMRPSRGMRPDQQYDDDACNKIKKAAAAKVAPLVWLLRRVGGRTGKKMASLLSMGMRTFETINTKKYDLQLFFGAAALLRLEAALSPEERADFATVWRPPPGAQAGSAAQTPLSVVQTPADWGSASGSPLWEGCEEGSSNVFVTGSKCLHHQPHASSITSSASSDRGGDAQCDGGASVSNASTGLTGLTSNGSSALTGLTGLTAISQAEAAHRAREGGWPLFNANALAFLYKSLYGRQVPLERKVSRRRVRKLLPHLTEEQVESARRVQHSFTAIR